MVLTRSEDCKELYSIAVLFKTSEAKVRMLLCETNLKSYEFDDRERICETLMKASRAIVEKTATESHVSETFEDTCIKAVCYAHIRDDGLSGVVYVQDGYPEKVAHSLITKVLDEFSEKVPKDQWSSAEEEKAPFENLGSYLEEYMYQDEDKDYDNEHRTKRMKNTMKKLKQDQDEMIMQLHSNIDAVLQRGQDINGLLDKSEDLNAQSDKFYMKAKKRSQCCVIL